MSAVKGGCGKGRIELLALINKNNIMKKIILSLSVIAVAAAVVVGATTAFFTDTETSTGNTFTAGAIDLTVDNESYVTDNDGDLVFSEDTSWDLSDLTNQLFFNFSDLKPGDIGEDTISLHVNSNDAWACMAINLTGTPDNGLTEPESDVDANGTDNGELQNYLNFAFWADDGDNVFEDDEEVFWEVNTTDFDGSWQTLADVDYDIWTGEGNPLQGNSEEPYFVGKAWCFGSLDEDPVDQDFGEDQDRSPLTAGTGFTCDGSSSNNDAQTDGITADVSFRAEQSRNNPDFTCGSFSAE